MYIGGEKIQPVSRGAPFRPQKHHERRGCPDARGMAGAAALPHTNELEEAAQFPGLSQARRDLTKTDELDILSSERSGAGGGSYEPRWR